LVILVLAGRPTPATPRRRTSIRNAGTAPYRTDFLPTNSREEPFKQAMVLSAPVLDRMVDNLRKLGLPD